MGFETLSHTHRYRRDIRPDRRGDSWCMVCGVALADEAAARAAGAEFDDDMEPLGTLATVEAGDRIVVRKPYPVRRDRAYDVVAVVWSNDTYAVVEVWPLRKTGERVVRRRPQRLGVFDRHLVRLHKHSWRTYTIVTNGVTETTCRDCGAPYARSVAQGVA